MLTLQEAQNHPLWAKQNEIEREMRSLGIERFRKSLEDARTNGQETRTGAVRRLMQTSHAQVMAALQSFYAEVDASKGGPKHSAVRYLEAMDDDDLVVHLTCRIILDSVVQRPRLSHLAVMIAEALEDECNYRTFREQHEAGYLKSAARARQKGNAKYRRQTVLGTAKKLNVNLVDWPKRDMIIVGSKLVELFMVATGLIQEERKYDAVLIVMAPDARQWIEEECRRSEWLSPMYLPTIIPPKPWEGPFDGGYWSGRARRLTLVKTYNRAYLTELADREMPEVYTAINALQNTAWAINRRVLDVMTHLWDTRSQNGTIPFADDEDLPEKPVWLVEGVTKETMSDTQRDEFVNWKSECVRVRDENSSLVGKRIAFSRMLWVADKFKDGELYFPYQMDWRGRAYPVGLYMHPQGNDSQRSLLEFADVCPINNEEAADWLAIHGAGLWGVDKVDFADRVQWVKENEARIIASAENPFDNLFWTEADKKPWQALAFCFDWAGFRAHGYGYESALPVQMDGTCNGLQNFSAILRDEVGGAAVNLMPADKPQDIYAKVAEIVIKRVEADLFSEERTVKKVKDKEGKTTTVEGVYVRDVAKGWVGHINRKTTKRPVMTLAYGARKYGFTDMVFDDTIKPWKKEDPESFPFGIHGWEAAQYMGGLIWDAVGEVVIAARAAMDWLQEAARVVSGEKLPINWTTPTGFLVQQAYWLRDMKTIRLAFRKVRVRVEIDGGSEKLDSKKQASGISPNWIHSLDSSHMMRTLCAATYTGVSSFSMIHDSYGTHAGNCAALATLLREEFVRMYSEDDVLDRFKTDLEAMLPEGTVLPPLPPKGSLDLSKVLESPFFFA